MVVLDPTYKKVVIQHTQLLPSWSAKVMSEKKKKG